jgi:hypothetical protein
MANALPTLTFSYTDGSELVISQFQPGLVLPNNSVKVRLNQTTVHLNQPALFTATGPNPTNFLESIKEGIRILELAAEALQGGQLESPSSSALVETDVNLVVLSAGAL